MFCLILRITTEHLTEANFDFFVDENVDLSLEHLVNLVDDEVHDLLHGGGKLSVYYLLYLLLIVLLSL